MPSAEEQFAAQLGANAAVQDSHPLPSIPLRHQFTSHIGYGDEYAVLASSYPEDVQLQLAMEASLATANAGQAQGNRGDQDSVNPGGNEEAD